MFKLNKLSAVIAIGLGSALPVQAGLLDDLIGAKYNPVSTNKGVAPAAQRAHSPSLLPNPSFTNVLQQMTPMGN